MLLCAIPASSIWASLTCRCRRQSSSVPCSALQCPAVRPTDRIPSHNGKRELAPQLHGNTPVQEKRIKALYGKELWHSSFLMALLHLHSFRSDWISVWYLLIQKQRFISRSGMLRWMHWCDVRGQILWAHCREPHAKDESDIVGTGFHPDTLFSLW